MLAQFRPTLEEPWLSMGLVRVVSITAGIFWLFALFAHLAQADGKFYYGDQVPRDVPYQRAILFHDGETETLLIQSSFHGAPVDVGWVVPVPALPEVAVLPEGSAWYLFLRLTRWTRTDVIHVFEWTIFLTFGLTIVIILLRGVIGIAHKFRQSPTLSQQNRLVPIVQRGYLFGFLILAPFWFFLPNLLPIFIPIYFCVGFVLLATFARPSVAVAVGLVVPVFIMISIPSYQDYGVESHSEYDAGPYHVHVVTAKTQEGIIMWLREQGFDFDEEDARTFQDYVERGWYFVTTKVRSGYSDEVLETEALVRPLVLRFPATRPVYPLALTGTTDGPTEIHLYAYASHRLTTDGRLTTNFAGKPWWPTDKGWPITEPTEILPRGSTKFPYLSVFSGKLAPEQMQTDLILLEFENDNPYRKRVYKY